MSNVQAHITEERLQEILQDWNKALQAEFDGKLARLQQSLIAKDSLSPDNTDNTRIPEEDVLPGSRNFPEIALLPCTEGSIDDFVQGRMSERSQGSIDDFDAIVSPAPAPAPAPTPALSCYVISAGDRTDNIDTNASGISALPAPAQTRHVIAAGGSIIEHPKSEWKPFQAAESLSLAEIDIKDAHLDMFQPTVWETVFFAGLPQVGFGGTAVLVTCLAINIAIQSLFTLIIMRHFASSAIDLEAVKRWRHVLGHDVSQVDFAGFSLVRQVCDEHPTLSVAETQAKLLGDIRTYSESTFDGTALCTAVTMIWFMMWLQEAERIKVFVNELWFTPSRARTHIRVEPDGQWLLESLPMRRKLFMFFVTSLRLWVSLALLFQGTRWLAFTTSMTDLVLNGAALAFVYGVDELIHDIAVPKHVKILEENLKINLYARSDHKFCYGLNRIVHLSVASMFAIGTFLFIARPHVSQMKDVIDAFCGGEHDFVVGHHAGLDMYYHVKTSTDASMSADGWGTIDDLIRGSSDAVSVLLPDIPMMESLLQLKPSEVAARIMLECKDSTSSELPVYWQKMLGVLEAPADASCKELSWACGSPSVHLVRMLCPATCKCHHSQPSTAFSKGCPMSACTAYYNKAVNCTDPTAPSLTANPHWRSYWESWKNWQNNTGPQAEIVDFALMHGCSVITEYQMHEVLCAAKERRLLTYHSLDSWCPEACDCQNSDVWGCPAKCRNR